MFIFVCLIVFNATFNNISVISWRSILVVGFSTTYAISAYHHWCCEFESRSGRGVKHYVIKFVSDLRQVGGFLWVLRFPPPIKLNATILWLSHTMIGLLHKFLFFVSAILIRVIFDKYLCNVFFWNYIGAPNRGPTVFYSQGVQPLKYSLCHRVW
jgi:hypothetical protein